MYFNSYAYIFLFLPVSVIGYFVVANWNMKASNCCFVVASLFFYGYWNISYLPPQWGVSCVILFASTIMPGVI